MSAPRLAGWVVLAVYLCAFGLVIVGEALRSGPVEIAILGGLAFLAALLCLHMDHLKELEQRRRDGAPLDPHAPRRRAGDP